MMIRVMFLCTGNSARSQMAEGLARHLGRGLIEPHSAGLSPAGVNPYAIEVMKEIGIDLSSQYSKSIDEDLLNKMDIVITLCGNAEASCPVTPPHIRRIHWPVDDPASVKGDRESILNAFRRVRDEIRTRIEELIREIKDSDN